MPAKTEKAAFCRSFDWTIHIQWFDTLGIHKLSDGRLVRIQLATAGTHDKYEGFRVKVLDKREGEIDTHYFAFADYLSEPTDDRIQRFHVYAGTGFRWYVEAPPSTRPLTQAIEEYVAAFL